MQTDVTLNFRTIPVLLRGEPDVIRGWINQWSVRRLMYVVMIIFCGAGLYGATMGCWRSPLQGLFTAVKLPVVLLLTALGNSFLNGMLAPLLGINLTFRQSLTVILLSFAITAVILGALSPVAAFVVWNTSPLSEATRPASLAYGFLQLTLTVFIALAGVFGNLQLMPLLRQWGASAEAAHRVLLAWLAGNLLLGSQICWILRPFIWDPARPVEFLGPEYLRGSFYETIFDTLRRLLSN